MARAEYIEAVKRLFISSKTEKVGVPAAIATVLFDNAKRAVEPEQGLTRPELAEAVNRVLEAENYSDSDERAPVIPDDLNTPLVRMAAKLEEFSAEQLPLLGITRITGPTKGRRDDTVGKIWLQIEFALRNPDAELIAAAIVDGANATEDGPALLMEVTDGVEEGSHAVMFARRPGGRTLLILGLIALMSVSVLAFPGPRRFIVSIVREFFGPPKPEPAPPAPTPRPRPSKPVPPPVLSLPGAGRDIRSVAAQGSRIFVAAGASGLRIIDVADHDMKVIGEYVDLPVAQDVVVRNETAFVTTGTAGVAVLDVSNPQRIRRIATIPALEVKRADGSIAHGSAHALVLRGSLLVVAEGSGMSIHDVADPHAPAPLGHVIFDNGSAVGVDVAENIAVVVLRGPRLGNESAGAGMAIVDITDARNPLVRSTRSSQQNAEHVVLSGRTAYIAQPAIGLDAIDCTDPYNAAYKSRWNGTVRGLALTSLGLLVTTDKGVARFATDDANHPTFLGFIEGVQSNPSIAGPRLCAVTGNDLNCTLLDKLPVQKSEIPPSK